MTISPLEMNSEDGQWNRRLNLCLLSCHDLTSDFETSIKIGVRHCRGKEFCLSYTKVAIKIAQFVFQKMTFMYLKSLIFECVLTILC